MSLSSPSAHNASHPSVAHISSLKHCVTFSPVSIARWLIYIKAPNLRHRGAQLVPGRVENLVIEPPHTLHAHTSQTPLSILTALEDRMTARKVAVKLSMLMKMSYLYRRALFQIEHIDHRLLNTVVGSSELRT